MTRAPDPARLLAIYDREVAQFAARTPKSAILSKRAHRVMPDGVPMAWMVGLHRHPALFVTGGQASAFNDVDGNTYVDFNLADLSNTVGYGANAVTRRMSAQAERGMQFLLPGEDAVAVAESLARRTNLPLWQFTISASSANTEVIRIARAFTDHQKIVMFDGKYHGHIDATMASGGAPGANAPAAPEGMGLSPSASADAINVPFNDLAALEAALESGDIALVIAEPALTNCTLVLPDPGFLDAVCQLARKYGALVCLDETHTWQLAFGGFVRAEALSPDFVTLGKGLGSGTPLGAYGMTATLGGFVERHRGLYDSPQRGLAIGGTTFGSALTMSAARAMLEDVATQGAYDRISALGARLADGIDRVIAAHDLPWCAFRYGPRSGFCLTPALPRNYDEAYPSMDLAFSDAFRVFMANRGIWAAIFSAGPQVSFAHLPADIDLYVELAGAFVTDALT
ncbi:MAG: aminotransferase class III-fold pyridoxal phosphate-dependent enzyme [Proteobacteria bacterium]|nr:aminotransferase class III-fold pyridoxal phosphate-dependent enzyme [Pseudomonadota bacterium]